MSEKLLDILKPQGDCIPESLLIRYAEGSLSASDARRVEEHVSECEFCSDALDGIMQNGNAKHFHSNLNSIRKIVHKRVKTAEPRETFPLTRMLAIAATLMLIAISAWYIQYLVNNNSQKVFSNEFKPYPALPQTQDTIRNLQPTVSDTVNVSVSAQNLSDKKVPPVNEMKKSTAKKQPEVVSESPAQNEADDIKQTTVSESENDLSATSQKDVSTTIVADSMSTVNGASNYDVGPHANATAPVMQDVTISKSNSYSLQEDVYKNSAEQSRREEAVSHFNNGMLFYQSSRYAEAIAEFQMVLKSDPNNPAANFYSGVSALALKNPDEALKYFRKTDNKTNQYYEASLWYESLAYLNKQDRKEAKKLLEKIVELNGEYKVKAEETLKQL